MRLGEVMDSSNDKKKSQLGQHLDSYNYHTTILPEEIP